MTLRVRQSSMTGFIIPEHLMVMQFSIIIFGSNRRARQILRTPPAAGRFDGVAPDSNRLPGLGNPPTPSASDLTLELDHY